MKAEKKEVKSLYGLVVCGGQSSRMGVDKSLLVYYDEPQRYYLYKMLKEICSGVFLSLNKNQDEKGNYHRIIDDNKYENIGPMASLLSAFEIYPNADFLVIGCDYPFIKLNHLKDLITESNSEKYAVSYFNSETKFREPLLSIYKSTCYDIIKKQFISGNYSLSLFLESINAGTIISSNNEILKSVDTVDAYNQAIKKLNSL